MISGRVARCKSSQGSFSTYDVSNAYNRTGSFLESESNSFVDTNYSFIQTVTTANSPQLLLSFCYLAYNNLFTRLQMAREWSLFGEGYHALRVTDPKVRFQILNRFECGC